MNIHGFRFRFSQENKSSEYGYKLWLRALGTIGTKNSWLMDGNSLNYGNNRFYPSPNDGNKDPGTSEILG